MIIDSKNFEDSLKGSYDLCIVGTGPAGAILAAELANSHLRICVLECGKQKTDNFHDRLRDVETNGFKIKEHSRERVLGGASTTWAGLSSPFDKIDFQKRDWVENSGWPIELDELYPYYERAGEKYRFPGLSFFRKEKWKNVVEGSEIKHPWSLLDEKIFLAAAEAQNFGKELRWIYESPNVDLVLDATVSSLNGKKESNSAKTITFFSSNKAQHILKAKNFVLATGGIENARILLNSKYSCPEGLGNEHDQVGRHFMNHPKNYCGKIKLKKPISDAPQYFGFMYGDFAGYFGLRLPENEQREQKLLNSYIRFEPIFGWSGNEGVESLVFFTKKAGYIMKAFKAMNKGKVVSIKDYSETGDDSEIQSGRKSFCDYVSLVLNIVKNPVHVLGYTISRFSRKKNTTIRNIRIRNFMEMEPSPQNRVTLGKGKDVFGILKPLVEHQTTELDKKSLCYVHETLAKEINASDWGKFTSDLNPNQDPWPIDADASHHMGTTRMGHAPESSVVDTNCRLHSTNNVYLAGSSVFPTSGNVNPTYTIAALSIRLAKHIKNKNNLDD